ncbi:hypothetical protein PISMIDRAFT_647575 [Pisolithus microcarpus 441]|uniref:Uncharacterized protein n=1 Tax=Pisolithus microcarpus 441 TaxID=765257 RepID=A0A0C9YQH8_9AGAM|nr:hypothetical protein BKA83DRAFT_647575 [Pisolithus microcarpus]KIK12612.1 hypothetical protein PISMIDRAFT_647575 [Pisolithus microcarpus 441]
MVFMKGFFLCFDSSLQIFWIFSFVVVQMVCGFSFSLFTLGVSSCFLVVSRSFLILFLVGRCCSSELFSLQSPGPLIGMVFGIFSVVTLWWSERL